MPGQPALLSYPDPPLTDSVVLLRRWAKTDIGCVERQAATRTSPKVRNPGVDDDVFREPMTLVEWLRRWVDCRLDQPALFEDPETGVVRPATDDDFARWEAEDDEP